jgi:sensor histidine kinase YesM
MLFCDKHFRVEFLKVERLVKFIGIPLFTIMSVIFLTPFPITVPHKLVAIHGVFAFIGVMGIWFSARWIIFFFRKHFTKMNAILRITIQIIVTSLFAFLICKFLSHFYPEKWIFTAEECPMMDEDYDLKNLYLISIIFNFLVNTIYESFYLFLRLSETLVETERFKKESIEAQYQNLTSRLNPHFLFNSLNTLTTIVEEDPKRAVEYIHELSIVYRYVLNSQKSTWTDLESEMKFTQSYITLLKMRFEDNLRIEVGLCKEHLNYYILPLTIQLLIENAVKHNEISNSHPLYIKVFCEMDDLVVANNKQLRTIMPSTTKVGLQNIKERYRFLVDKVVFIEDLEKTFTVKVPLMKMVKNGEEQVFGNQLNNTNDL